VNDISILRSILDSMAEAVVASNTDFKLIYFNKAAERLHGVGLSDIPHEDWGERYGIFLSDAITPCPQDQIPLVRVLRGEMPEALKLYVKRPDGSGSHVDISGRPLLDDDGIIVGGLVVFADITDRIKTERALHKSEANLHTVLDHMPAMIAYWNADLHNEFGNNAYEEWFGISPAQMRGRHIREVIGEELYALNKPYIQGALRGSVQLFERAIKDSNGENRYTQASYIPDVSGGDVKGFFVLVTDITQRRQAELAHQESEERFRDMAVNAPGIVYQFIQYPDGRAYYRYVSSKIKDILGIEPEALMADPSQWFDLIHPDDKQQYLAQLQKDAEDLAYRNWEGRLLLRDGTVKWVNSLATPRSLADGGVLWNGLMLDITERKQMELELKRRADTDYLTGVANRGYFLKMAALELARTRRYGGALSIAMIDLDHFKNINDTYGHLVGDAVLKEMATISHRVLREADLVGRLGGEEFAVLLPETDASHTVEVIERLRKAVAASEIPLEDGQALHFTVSIGIATFIAETDTSIDMLLNRADQALYMAKQSGRNQVCTK